MTNPPSVLSLDVEAPPICPTCQQPMRRLPITRHWYCKPCDTSDRLAGRVPTALDIAAAPPVSLDVEAPLKTHAVRCMEEGRPQDWWLFKAMTPRRGR